MQHPIQSTTLATFHHIYGTRDFDFELSIENGDINTMNECFTMLGYVDKLQQIEKIKSLQTKATQESFAFY